MGDATHTGTRDEHYDLVSVLYRTLHEAEPSSATSADGRNRGDDQLAAFFEELQAQDRDRTERAKQLLKDRTRQMVRDSPEQ